MASGTMPITTYLLSGGPRGASYVLKWLGKPSLPAAADHMLDDDLSKQHGRGGGQTRH
jgi:hypothetical protein